MYDLIFFSVIKLILNIKKNCFKNKILKQFFYDLSANFTHQFLHTWRFAQ
jgi:hypothetical protein